VWDRLSTDRMDTEQAYFVSPGQVVMSHRRCEIAGLRRDAETPRDILTGAHLDAFLDQHRLVIPLAP